MIFIYAEEDPAALLQLELRDLPRNSSLAGCGPSELPIYNHVQRLFFHMTSR
jgi:hypothetical protein